MSKPISGAEEAIGFYYELGLAITAWAEVELMLCWVAMMAFPKSQHETFYRAFFSIDAFYNKIKVAERLYKAKYKSKQHTDIWITLRNQLERLSLLRNQLAHCPAERFEHGKPGRRLAIVWRAREPTKIKQRIPKAPSDSLCIKEIIHAREQFEAIAIDLQFLYYTLKNRRKPPKAFVLRVAGVRDSDLVARRTRAILSTPFGLHPVPKTPSLV